MNPPTHDTNGACSITCDSSATRIRYADAKPRVELEHTTKRENVPVSLSPVEQPSISACVVQSPWPVKSSISRFPGADTSSTNQVKNCGTWKAHFKEPHNKSAPEPHSRARKSSIGGLVGSPHPRKCGTIEPEKTCRRHRLSPAVIPHLHGQVGDDDENEDEDNDDDEGDDDNEGDDDDVDDDDDDDEDDDEDNGDDDDDDEYNRAAEGGGSKTVSNSSILLHGARKSNVTSILESKESHHAPTRAENDRPSICRRGCLAFVEAPVCRRSVAHERLHDTKNTSYTQQRSHTAPLVIMERAKPRRSMSLTLNEHDASDPCSTWVEQGLEVDDAYPCREHRTGHSLDPITAWTAPASRQSYSLRHSMHPPLLRASSTPGHVFTPLTPPMPSPEHDKTEELALVAERLLLHQEDETDISEHASGQAADDSDNDDGSVEDEPQSPSSISMTPRTMSFYRDPHATARSSPWPRSLHASVTPVPRPLNVAHPPESKPRAYSVSGAQISTPSFVSSHRPCVQPSCIAVSDGHLRSPPMAAIDCQHVQVGSPPCSTCPSQPLSR